MNRAAFEVNVPCSTSNLGAGFDALGLALGGPRVRVRVEPGGDGLRIASLTGEGAPSLPRDGSNRVLAAAREAAVWAGCEPSQLEAALHIDSSIPLARGLGSSAAAALAGALVADALLGGAVGERGILGVAVAMEGHPDNVVPSLFGGARVAIVDGNSMVRQCPIGVARPLHAALFVPEQHLATSDARAVVPQSVSLADAVYNLGRAALFVGALGAGKYELLAEAMGDRLHQPARTRLMPWLPAMIAASRVAGAHGAALSGAGTTICALCDPDASAAVVRGLEDEARRLDVPGRAIAVEAAVDGARVS